MPSVFSVSFSHIPPAEYAQTFVKLADFGRPRRAGYSSQAIHIGQDRVLVETQPATPMKMLCARSRRHLR